MRRRNFYAGPADATRESVGNIWYWEIVRRRYSVGSHMRMNKVGFVLALAVVAACKDKDKSDKAAPAEAPQAGSAAGSAAASPTAVKLSAGEATFGCIGWAPATKTAACVTGVTQANEPSVYQVSYVGASEPPSKLAVGPDAPSDVLDDEYGTEASAVLVDLATCNVKRS